MNNIANPLYRFISWLIDKLIISMIFTYLVYKLSDSTNMETVLSMSWYILIILLVVSIIILFVDPFMTYLYGGTFGKLLTGIAVVDSNGKNISFWMAFFRKYIGYIVSGVIFWLGFIWIFVDKDRRSWHDMMADTYVVVTKKAMPIVGILILVILLGIQISLVTKSVANFYKNSSVYTELLN